LETLLDGIPPRELLRRARPDLVVETLEPAGSGDFCDAWLVNGREILRIAKHGEARVALARECRLLPRIAASLPLAVPQPRPLEIDGAVVATLHQRVPGKALDLDAWYRRHQSRRLMLPRELGKFLRALHDVDVGAVADCGLPALHHHALAHRLRESLASDYPPPQIAVLRDELDDALCALLELEPVPPVLLHADVSPEHVLFDPWREQLSGVIDWGDAAIGDPARDFIFLYEDWSRDFLRSALEAYETNRLERRVLLHYIADQLDWTLAACGRGEPVAQEGAAALRQALTHLARA